MDSNRARHSPSNWKTRDARESCAAGIRSRCWITCADLNRSADGIYMEGVLMRLRRRGRGLGQRLQRAAAAGLHLGGAARQPGEELGHLLLYFGLGAQAGVGGDLLARPG